jgi:hypothetical protein
MKSVILKIAQLRTLYVFGLALACSLCVFGLVQLVEPWYTAHFGEIKGPELSEFSKLEEFFAVSLFAPVFETLLCQWLPIYLLLRIKYIKSHYWIPVVVSVLCFAVQHHYCVLYFLYACVGGWIFATSFLVFKERHSYSRAFWLTALEHGVFNFVVFLILNL